MIIQEHSSLSIDHDDFTVEDIVTDVILFPFAEYWTWSAAFVVGVLIVLAVDLGLFHRTAHMVSFHLLHYGLALILIFVGLTMV